MSQQDKMIFPWWMVQADSNVIKSEYFIGSTHHEKISLSVMTTNEKKLPPPHHEKIILSCGDRKKS